MSLHKKYSNNRELEAGKGIVVEYEGGSVKLHMRRAGGLNESYTRVLREKLEPHQRRMKVDTLPDALAKRLLAETYAETVIIGWEGVTDKSDNAIAFSVQACTELLLELPDFFDLVREDASNLSMFKEAQLEADEKN